MTSSGLSTSTSLSRASSTTSGGVADQRAGEAGARHGADHRHRRVQLVRGTRDEHVGRAFLDVQMLVVHPVLGLERLAGLA